MSALTCNVPPEALEAPITEQGQATSLDLRALQRTCLSALLLAIAAAAKSAGTRRKRTIAYKGTVDGLELKRRTQSAALAPEYLKDSLRCCPCDRNTISS
jgi:hypothetical protein